MKKVLFFLILFLFTIFFIPKGVTAYGGCSDGQNPSNVGSITTSGAASGNQIVFTVNSSLSPTGPYSLSTGGAYNCNITGYRPWTVYCTAGSPGSYGAVFYFRRACCANGSCSGGKTCNPCWSGMDGSYTVSCNSGIQVQGCHYLSGSCGQQYWTDQCGGNHTNGCSYVSCCTPESNATFCSRLGKNCGSVTASDNCGTSRTVNSCGTCTSPQTCGGGGTANVCGCTPTTTCPATPATCSGACGTVTCPNGCGGTNNCTYTPTAVNVSGTVSFSDATTHSVDISTSVSNKVTLPAAKTATPFTLTVPVRTTQNLSASVITDYVTLPNQTYSNISVACSNLSNYNFTYNSNCTGVYNCSLWSACSNHTRTENCIDAGCPSIPRTINMPCNDAGAVVSTSTINSGTGNVSTQGSGSGFRLPLYTRNTILTRVNYAAMLSNIFKNAGISRTFLESQSSYNQATGYSVNAAGTYYRFWKLSGSTTALDSLLGQVIGFADPYNSINVILPTTSGTDPKSSFLVSPRDLTSSTKNIVIFVNGSLDISANITIGPNASMVFVLNNAGGVDVGNLTLYQSVTRLDGLYIFPGNFDDAWGPQLVGYGSLIATGNSINLGSGFQRYNDTGPAEQWFYQAKYLSTYANVLSIPSYNWSEISPQ